MLRPQLLALMMTSLFTPFIFSIFISFTTVTEAKNGKGSLHMKIRVVVFIHGSAQILQKSIVRIMLCMLMNPAECRQVSVGV